MCVRTGATAAPRETFASASAIASATRRGSRAKIASRSKWRWDSPLGARDLAKPDRCAPPGWRSSDTRLFANGGERLEEVHRLLAARDGELEHEVVDPELSSLAKVGDHLGAQAPKRRAPSALELLALPPLLGGGFGDLLGVLDHLQAGPHCDLELLELPAGLRQLALELGERGLELLEGEPIPDPAVPEARGAPQRRRRGAAHEHRQPPAGVRPWREAQPRKAINLARELRRLAVPARAHGGEGLVRDARAALVRHAHELGLRVEPPQARADDKPATRQLVGGRKHLREQQRMAVR